MPKKVFDIFNGVKRFVSVNLKSSRNTYEDAIVALNSLQSNTAAISNSIKLKQLKHDEANFNLRDTEKFLIRAGLSLETLDRLSVIHVAGTKGKGSTCSYTDAILNHHNVKTGLFTSPHLTSVTERIKLSGQPISKDLFCEYFWEIFNSLQTKKDNEQDLPSYFKFLTIMAYYIFVKEKVDVAIVEVGIGGEYDSTNIIKKTEIVGITSIHLEHTQLLGETLAEIAWQKAGIIKENSVVYTMPQSREVMEVIQSRQVEKNAKSLSVTPEFEDYEWSVCSPDVTATSVINKINISLAIQLSSQWMRKNNKLSIKNLIDDPILHSVNENFVKALCSAHCDGRFQKFQMNGIGFFLDGAHTKESLVICGNWFQQQVQQNSNSINILLFNLTGDRDSESLLKSVHNLRFHHVIFTTNIPTKSKNSNKKSSENFHLTLKNTQLERCQAHHKIWSDLDASQNINESLINVCESIQQALEIIYNIKDNNDMTINVLVTGSLHLVGATLGLLDSSRD